MDLPDPDGPISATFSPGWTSKSNRSSTVRLPKRLVTPSKRMMGVMRSPAPYRNANPRLGRTRSSTCSPAEQDQREDEEDQSDHRQRHQILERAVADHVGEAEHVEDRHHGQHRRLLQHRDEIVAHRRQDARDRLRDHDVAIGPQAREVERRRRLPLGAGHGVQPAAIDLGGVGGILQAERQGSGQEGRQHDAVDRAARSRGRRAGSAAACRG